MLPPVRTTLSSFVDYQNQPQQPLPRQRIDVASNAASPEMVASAPLSGGRLDILSLSAQLQLAQGFSIFAETIGKLIKLPRREGEALLDYAKRLLEAVKAMNPAERSALERMLNQLVRGVTFRLLTEVLNNPAGPDAARFAMRMETAQLLDRDLAAKAVVSSYRQNAGEAPAVNPPPRPANTAPIASGPTGSPSAANAAAPSAQADRHDADADAAHPAAVPDAPIDLDEPANSKTAGSLPGPEEAATLQPLSATSDTETEAQPDLFSELGEADIWMDTAGGSEVETVPDAGLKALGDDAGNGTSEPVLDTMDDMAGDQPEKLPSVQGLGETGRRDADTAPSSRRTSSPVFYDGPALARQSQRGFEPARTAVAPMDRMTIPTMAALLAEVFTENVVDFLRPLQDAEKVPPERQALKDLLGNASTSTPAIRMGGEAGQAAGRAGAPVVADRDNASHPVRPVTDPAGAAGPWTSSTELAEQLALPLLLPHILREGVPLPYVAYPPEGRERDPDERKTRAVSATDEDGEQQQSANGQSFQDEAAGDDPQGQASEEVPDEEKEDAERANDLYWRMAGWA